ncbi:hypothetical protein [Rosistilla oblonga]|uniref:hypothetical protein n=1 Tax=Rosistilla oblonga TaxID=2527990 RepID=UPI003A980485
MTNYQGLPDSLSLMLMSVSLLVAFWFSGPRDSGGGRVVAAIDSLSKRPWISLLLVFAVSLLTNLGLTLIRYPLPRIHDEFSYLLAADTYASGRLTNPTHPYWKHFETYHVLSQPSYMSKYPPGNGIFLALGQVTTGHPIVGSWLALALGIAATYWALRGWIHRRWALIAGLLLAINVPMLMAWGQTYWGGGVQLLGGSLLIGALRRITDRDRWPRPVWQYASLFACGAVILANSRPLEGFLLCGVAAIVLLRWLWKSPASDRINNLVQVALPSLLIGGIGIAGLAINNAAVTGRATQLPYSAHSKQYTATSMVIWNAMPPVPEYNLPAMEAFYRDWCRQRQLDAQTFAGYTALVSSKLQHLSHFYTFMGGLCLLPTLALIRRDRWLLFAVAVVLGLLLIEFQFVHSRTFPHYVAPVACLFYVAMFQSLRWLHAAGHSNRLARMVLPTIVVYSLLALIAYAVGNATRIESPNRSEIVELLEQEPGKHLVLVEYSPDHNVHREWVYNRADIDNAPIVWAHRLGPEADAPLLKHFADRNVWLWQADRGAEGLSQIEPPADKR